MNMFEKLADHFVLQQDFWDMLVGGWVDEILLHALLNVVDRQTNRKSKPDICPCEWSLSLLSMLTQVLVKSY